MSITEQEINNQFGTWLNIDEIINDDIEKFIENIQEDEIVVFTGAGTSGYIGDTLAPLLNKGLSKPKYFSYYSTHIVGDRDCLINKNQKVVLVSFGRSGNSPESIEAINIVNKLSSSVKHLIITCNDEGELSKYEDAVIVNLPAITNDVGFAMTNSFSTMTLTAYQIFKGGIDFKNLVDMSKKLYVNFNYDLILAQNFNNIIHLANTSCLGITSEYLLKTNELTNGKYAYYNDQILNFRHGPKSVITKKSIIFLLKSNNSMSNLYEDDLIKELLADENEPIVIVLGETNCDVFYQTHITNLEPIINMFVHLPAMQLLAVKLSEKNEINPDNPSPSGSVNRVVQGVIIH